MIKIYIYTKINYTEDLNKILTVINNITNVDCSMINKYITDLNGFYILYLLNNDKIELFGSLHLIRNIYFKVRDLKIIDTLRELLIKNIKTNEDSYFETEINLNKQVAYIGKINIITDNTPLGNINIKIISNKKKIIYSFIDWIAPKTKNGIIIGNNININDKVFK